MYAISTYDTNVIQSFSKTMNGEFYLCFRHWFINKNT